MDENGSDAHPMIGFCMASVKTLVSTTNKG